MVTKNKRRALCFACGQDFGYDWHLWAKHIQEMCAKNKKDTAHKRSKKFAAKILTNVRKLDAKKDTPVRMKLTEQDKENKISTIREVSGDIEQVYTVCPGRKCFRQGVAVLPVEYTQSEHAWKIGDKFAILCNVCRG